MMICPKHVRHFLLKTIKEKVEKMELYEDFFVLKVHRTRNGLLTSF